MISEKTYNRFGIAILATLMTVAIIGLIWLWSGLDTPSWVNNSKVITPASFRVKTLETDQFQCAIIERQGTLSDIQCFPKEK